MQLRNSPEKFGGVTKTFHWLTALTVIGLLCVGLYMTRAEKSAAIFPLYSLHKSFGILVLAATALRVLWHFYSRKPGLVPGMAAWEKAAAHAGHFFLYICLFGMPLTGWLMSSSKGRQVKLFDAVPLPDLISKNHELGETLESIHGYLAYALIAMIVLHAAAALKHHFISHDATLRRMLPFARDRKE